MMHSVLRNLLCVGIAASGLVLFSGCEEKEAGNAAATGVQATAAANADASMAAQTTNVRTVSGIQVEDVLEGTGKEAKKGNTISVNYTGTLANSGRKFDSSYDRNQPFTFRLGSGQVIEGWDKGLIGMKEGGKRILTIPPDKGYGVHGHPPVIPGDATLKFEVELVEIK